MGANKSFCIVCIANYCRSPVVENLLKNRFGDGKYEFFSAGVAPISQPNMDLRSAEFLEANGVDYDLHTPKKINKRMLDYFDIFLAVDFFVLNQLNHDFPKYRQKFRLLTTQFTNIDIVDPFRFEEDEYSKVMNDIQYVSENINLDEIL